MDFVNKNQEGFINLQQELEKFKMETEYVCLKLGHLNWMQFLTDVRTGNVIKVNHQKQEQQPSPEMKNTLKPLQLPFPERTKNQQQQQSFDAMFNDIL